MTLIVLMIHIYICVINIHSEDILGFFEKGQIKHFVETIMFQTL